MTIIGLIAISNIDIDPEKAQELVLTYLGNRIETLTAKDLPDLEKIRGKFFFTGSSSGQNIEKLDAYIHRIKRGALDSSELSSKSGDIFKSRFSKFSPDQLKKTQLLAQEHLFDEQDGKIVKLSRRIFSTLSNSIFATKKNKQVFMWVYLHRDRPSTYDEFDKEDPTLESKGFLGKGGDKVVYLLPAITEKTDDLVRCTFKNLNLALNIQNAQKKSKELIYFYNHFKNIETEYFDLNLYTMDKTTGIITQLAPKYDMTLIETIRRYQLSCVQKMAIFIELLKALDVLHSKGWNHGDLHLDNIMVVKESSKPLGLAVKLVDFDRVNDLDSYRSIEFVNVLKCFNRLFNKNDVKDHNLQLFLNILFSFCESPPKDALQGLIKLLERKDLSGLKPIELK